MQGRSGKRGALLTFAILLTVSSGTAYAADPIEIKETTSIAVKDGASYSYGSDETESLTIAVENSDDGAAIAVDGSSAAGGSKASLTLSGKNIAVTVPKGIFNGNTEGGIIPSNDTGTAYAGGTVQIGSESTDVVKVSGELRTVGAGAATTLRGSQITTDAVNTYNEGETTFGTEETRLVTLKKTNTLNHASLTVLGKQIVFKDEAATDSGTTNEIGHEYIYAVNGSSVTIGSDATESVHVGGRDCNPSVRFYSQRPAYCSWYKKPRLLSSMGWDGHHRWRWDKFCRKSWSDSCMESSIFTEIS